MKLNILIPLLLLMTLSLSAQVSINSTHADPDPSAMLDVQSTTKGLLVPRMNTAQRTAIAAPATGLLVFDNTTNSFWVWNGTQWKELDVDVSDDFSGSILEDADGDTKVVVEASPDEDIIHLSAKNAEILQLNENGLFSAGTFDAGGVPPVNGAGIRLMWIPKRGALRIGEVTGTQWDSGTIENYSSILGGKNNSGAGPFSTIGGGTNNSALGTSAFLGGGQSNAASGSSSFLGGGVLNVASGDYTVVGGGLTNTASGDAAGVTAGEGNNASGSISFIGGGQSNTASGQYSGVSGGKGNLANGDYAQVAGGFNNTASGEIAGVGAGEDNNASGFSSFIGGGKLNVASGDYSLVAGGLGNIASGRHAFVGGGESNIAYSYAEAVFGSFPIIYTPAPGSDTTFVSTDRLFVVGNGVDVNNRSNALTIFKNGDIGIGTANPEGKLHVAGDYFGKGHIWLYSTGGHNTNGNAFIQARDKSGTTDIGLRFRTQNAGSFVEVMTLDKLGNIGIGDISPANQVVIRRDSNDMASNELVLKNYHPTASGTGSRLVFQGYRDVNTKHEVASIEVEHKPGDLVNLAHGGAMVFRTNPGDSPYPQKGPERMRISEDGIISIQNLLDVNGGLDVSGGMDVSGVMKMVNGNINLNGYYLSGDGGANGIRVAPDGNVGIGNAGNTAHFYIHGTNGNPYAFAIDSDTGDGSIDFTVESDGSIYAPLGGNSSAFPVNVVKDNQNKLRYAVSSRRYKTNIQAAQLSGDVEKFLSLELKAFQFKGDSSMLYDYGFIAEEVDALGLSRPLAWKKDGQVESLYFDHIAFFNFAALQQHRDQIQVLEEKLLQKEERMAGLEAENARIKADFEARIQALEARIFGPKPGGKE